MESTRETHVDRLGPQTRYGAPDPPGIEQIDRPRQGHRFPAGSQRDSEPREPFDGRVKNCLADTAFAGERAAVAGAAIGQSPNDKGSRLGNGRSVHGPMRPSIASLGASQRAAGCCRVRSMNRATNVQVDSSCTAWWVRSPVGSAGSTDRRLRAAR